MKNFREIVIEQAMSYILSREDIPPVEAAKILYIANMIILVKQI